MVTSTYKNIVADRVFEDITRAEINNKEAEIIEKIKVSNTLVELTLRPLEEIKSLSIVRIYDDKNRPIHTKVTNINIQDMYNIEIKVRIGVE